MAKTCIKEGEGTWDDFNYKQTICTGEATPVVRESWPGARRRRGKGRNVQGKVLVTVSPIALPACEGRRAAMGSPANALMNQKQMTRRSMQWKIFLSFAFDSSM